MKVTIRRALPNDADFIAWLILTAGRAHVKRGIVGRLLAEIIAAGREKGFSRAQINIYIGNDPARRLYEKHGFKVVDEIRDPYFQQQIGSPGMA